MAKHTRIHISEMPEIGPGLKHLSKEQFGRVLYRKMLEKGWNQSELARAADLPRDSVSKYIRGVTTPSQQSLQALADALGTTAEELLPNHVEMGLTQDTLSMEIRTSPGAPNAAWLRVNQLVSIDTALKVAALLNQEPETEK